MCVCVCVCIPTWASRGLDGSGDGQEVGAVLCDGFDWQLVLTQRRLLHYGDGLQGLA